MAAGVHCCVVRAGFAESASRVLLLLCSCCRTATLPVVTNTGNELGSCYAHISPESVVERLEFMVTARDLFKSPQLSAKKTAERFVVETPALQKPTPVSVMECVYGNLEKLTDCFSVTTKGQPRCVSVMAEAPDANRRSASVIADLLNHQSLSYLKGLKLQLAGRIGGKWEVIDDKIPEADITELGLVVPEDSVRVVELKFGESTIPMVLRRRAGKTLLEDVKQDCDWHAWPAVSACTEDVTFGANNVIEMKGELLCRVSRLGDSLVVQACTGSSGPHSRIS
jgi:hypothetical protein